MPVKVSCKCGQSFTAKDELVGQTLLCPKCHQPLTIGGGEATAKVKHGSHAGMDDLLDEIGLKQKTGPVCPKCSAEMSATAIICVSCGFHRETGQALQGVKSGTGSAGHSAAAESLLVQAAERLESDKLEDKKTRSQGTPTWLLFVSLLLVIGFTATMYLLPRDQAFNYTGWAIISLAGIVQIICSIRILIIAFYESPLHGVLSLFVPFYSLYYIFSRWPTCGSLFLMSLVAGMVQLFGLGFVALSPMLKPKETKLDMPPRAVHVAVRSAEEHWAPQITEESA